MKEAEDKKGSAERNVVATPSAMFFQYNTQLGPPFHVLVDTNFINFSIKNKLEPYRAMMDCLLAKCIPCVTDCVMAELEKLGDKYRLALRMAKDPRFERLPCSHQGTYADDCLLQRCEQHRCYIVATCDKELKRRIRKVRPNRRTITIPHLYLHIDYRFLEYLLCISMQENIVLNECQRHLEHPNSKSKRVLFLVVIIHGNQIKPTAL